MTSPAALAFPAIGFLLLKITPDLMEVALGTPGRPTTARLVAMHLRVDTLGIFTGGLITFFAATLIWRERESRQHDIVDVLPVRDRLLLGGKFGALALLVLTLQFVQLMAGIITQIGGGISDHEFLLFTQVLFGLKFVDALIFAAVAMALQVIVNQKYLASALSLLLWLFADYAAEFGVHHNLLVFGGAPDVRYSDMSGFGATLEPWMWFKTYWLGWMLLTILLARLFWVRGHDTSLRARLALGLRRISRPTIVVASMAIALLVGAGGFVFYNTNVLNEYVTDASLAKRSASYEAKYRRYDSLPRPSLVSTRLLVDLRPTDGTARISGTYSMVNRTGRAIDSLHLVTQPSYAPRNVRFDRAVRAALVDDTLGYRIYTFDRPLPPGATARMNFDVLIARRGFTNNGRSSAIEANGTLLEHRPDSGGRSWLPSIGYRRGVELTNAFERREHGLPPRAATSLVADRAAVTDERGLERIDLETILSTEEDQIAVAPGALRRSWTQNGRRFFHYVTDAPIRNGFAILSARYEVHRSNIDGIDVEVLFDRRHAWNVDRFAQAARAALHDYSRAFGPYPHRQLRLVEFPATGGNRMTSHPGTIVWSEAFAYAQPENDWRKIDFPYAVVAHEVAHQWWGNELVPARVDGAALLTESLAWFSAMNVVEHSLGRDHLERTLDAMRASYLAPHETPDAPLLRARDWLAAYRTGALAMYTLRERIGEHAVNQALARLVTDHRGGHAPFATSLDLYRNLTEVTPPSSRTLLRDLFEDITFWDLRMRSVRASNAGSGRSRLTMEIEAHKIKVDAEGRERHVPMRETIDVAIFAAAGNDAQRGATLYRRPHTIHDGAQTITVDIAGRAASAAIDPEFRLLDRKRDDNGRAVQ